MKLKPRGVAAALFFTAICAAQGQLTWEKTEIELHPKQGDKEAVAQFRYENKGSTPIHIRNVRSSCGCTVASLKKNDVAPGEKGEVTATFNIGGRTGVQQKVVTVETDDPARPVTNLVLKAVIEPPLSVQPSFVFWQMGEPAQPKKVTVKSGKDMAITKIDVTSSAPEFKTKVEKGSAPGEFIITVVPSDTSKPLNAQLTIKPDIAQTFIVTARVTPSTAAPAR